MEVQLRLDNNALLTTFLTGHYKKIASDVYFAYALGYKANLSHFQNPLLPPFFEADPSTYLQEYVMFQMPGRLEADQLLQNIIDTVEETFYDKYLQPISEYFAFFETTAPKYAHIQGFLDADEHLYSIVPGYAKDSLFTLHYKKYFSALYGIE